MKSKKDQNMSKDKFDLQEVNWKSYLDDFHEGIVITDNNGKHIYANDAYCKLTGYSLEEMLKLNIKDLVDPEVLEDLKMLIKNRLNDSDLPYTSELKIIKKDGTKIDIKARGHKVLWGDKYVDLAATSNITEQRLEEQWFKSKNNFNNSLKRFFSTDLCFNLLCKTIEEVQLFKQSILTMHDKNGKIIHWSSNGVKADIAEMIASFKPLTVEQTAFIRQDKFKIRNSYFIPDGQLWEIIDNCRRLTSNTSKTKDLNLWQPGDELIIPFVSDSKKINGYLSVDTPFNGRRPDMNTVSKLEELLDAVTRRLNEIRHQEIIFESERNYRAITEQSVLPIAIYQQERFKYVNQAFCDLSGYTRKEIVSWNEIEARSLVHPDDLKRIIGHDKKLGSNLSRSTRIMLRGITKAGEIKWLEGYARKFIYEEHDSLLVILIDRTQEKKLEIDLLKSEDRIRDLLNATHDAVILCDLEGNMLDLNDTFARRFKRSRKSMLGTNVWKLFPPEITRIRKKNLAELIKTKKMITMSDTRDGMVNLTNIFPMYDSNGNINRIAIFARDITEEIETAKKLRQAEKLAAVGNLAAGIVHQIRNPLGNISFAAQLSLQQENLDKSVKEYLELILNDTEHANKVIRKLTEYSNPKEIVFKPSSILDPINKAISFSGSIREIKKIDLKFKFPEKLPLMNISDYWIEQIMINIINNSIQAISENGVININIELKNKTEMKILIKDNGCGIFPDIISQVFDPFFSTKNGGVGLGLSMVNKIIELHKGSVSIDSKEGEFTQIKITLPIKKQKKIPYKMLMLPL